VNLCFWVSTVFKRLVFGQKMGVGSIGRDKKAHFLKKKRQKVKKSRKKRGKRRKIEKKVQKRCFIST